MQKLILFDVDYTLVRGSKLHKKALVQGIKEIFGIEADIDRVNLPGMTDWQIILDLLRLYKIPESELTTSNIKKCMAKAVEYYVNNKDEENTTLLEGVRETLELLSRINNIILGLLTGNIEEIAYGKLESVGIAEYFKVGGFGSDHIIRSKLVDIALQRAGKKFGFVRNNNVFIVGDTPKDVRAAKEAGVYCIAVATGKFGIDELKNTGADLVLKNLTSINNFLDFVNNTSVN